MTSKGPVDKRLYEQSRWGRKRGRALGRLPPAGLLPSPLALPTLPPSLLGDPPRACSPSPTHRCLTDLDPGAGSPPDLLRASRHLNEQTPPGCCSPASPAQGRLSTQVSQAL